MNCIKKEKYIKYININLLKPKGKTNSICMDMIKVEVDDKGIFCSLAACFANTVKAVVIFNPKSQ